MHFGEYELSPSLISLSPPPSAHPEAFQRLLVRPSRWCYPSFSLAKGRSLGFASAPSDCTPYSDSLSLRLQVSRPLTLPEKATRRFIMQKARRHAYALRPLVMVPADSRRIPRAPRYSGYRYASSRFVYGPVTLYGPTFQKVPLTRFLATARSYNPRYAVTYLVWALPRSLATTRGIIIYFLFLQVLRCFSSLR